MKIYLITNTSYRNFAVTNNYNYGCFDSKERAFSNLEKIAKKMFEDYKHNDKLSNVEYMTANGEHISITFNRGQEYYEDSFNVEAMPLNIEINVI